MFDSRYLKSKHNHNWCIQNFHLEGLLYIVVYNISCKIWMFMSTLWRNKTVARFEVHVE